jgi:cytochrome c556
MHAVDRQKRRELNMAREDTTGTPLYNCASRKNPLSAMLKNLLCAVLTVGLLTACGEPEDTRPGQPVKTRQLAFKEFIRQFEPMGKMLRDNRYDAARFLKFAEALDAAKDAPWTHFGPDTQYPPSKSTDAVWQQTAAFAKERDAFLAATGKLLEAARSQDKAQVDAPYKAVYDACQSCHRQFRQR